MRKIPLIIITLLFLSAHEVRSQYYETGQDPSSVDWMQIKTGRFTVIYPKSYGSGGLQFTQALDSAYSKLSVLYPQKKFKIPVIIHNLTTQSNGYVAWAPRRMEIYPTPEQNSIPLDNFYHLATHELTHVLQMSSLNSGLIKGLSVVLGEQIVGVSAIFLPLWFLEGEAVFAESVLSNSGRGRSPNFLKQSKAIAVEREKIYKYDKMLNGSFRNFIPDHYSLGYELVTMSRIKYKPQLWNKALKLTANAPFTINPVNLSLRSNAGITKKKLYNETFDTLKIIWSKEIKKKGAIPYESINPAKRGKFSNYYSPVKTGKSTIAAIKTSLSDPPSIVLINKELNTEEKINTPGLIYPFIISSAQSVLIWVEVQSDPRWQNRNYSVIKILDLRDKTIKQLTWKTRYMSASISPDGKTIAATENTIDNQNNLVLINVKTRRIIASVPSLDNSYLQRPQWSVDGDKITFITLTKNGEGIVSFTHSTNKWEKLITESNEDFQSTLLRNDSLFYVSSKDGTENIFVLSPEKKTYRLTNSIYGATDFLLEGNNLIFCDYTISGNNICQLILKDELVKEPVLQEPALYQVDRVKLPDQTNSYKPSEYTPKPYKKWQHPFKFHSWMPFYTNLEEVKLDPASVKPGFMVMSQNHLSTLISTFGYEYSDDRHKFHSLITWKKWYPVYELRFDYGDENQIYKSGVNISDPSNIMPAMNVTSKLSVPLTFNSGKFNQYLNPSISAIFQNTYMYMREDSLYDKGQTQIAARFYFANYYRHSHRDIIPRWAQVIDFNFSYFPFDKEFFGSFITLRTALYFPGIFKNNGIKIRYENDVQFVEKNPLWNRVSFPRSYKNIASEELSLLSIDYKAPLLYPDFNFFSLLYLKRIRTGLFYDYASGTGNYYFQETNGSVVFDTFHNYTEIFSSYGFELIADFYAIRLPYMFSTGLQTSWQRGNKSPFFELLFNIDIFGMNIGRSKL